MGYGILRVITGMGGIGCFMVCFVLAVEHVGFKFTMLIGIAIEIPFALGEAILGIEAFIVRDWRSLQILAYLPMLGMIITMVFCQPHSHLSSLGGTEVGGAGITEMADQQREAGGGQGYRGDGRQGEQEASAPSPDERV